MNISQREEIENSQFECYFFKAACIMQEWIFVMRRAELAVNYIACIVSYRRREAVLLHNLWLFHKLKQFLCYTALLQLKFLILESVHQGLHVVSDRNFLVEFSIEISRCEAGSDPRCAGQSVTESLVSAQWHGEAVRWSSKRAVSGTW